MFQIGQKYVLTTKEAGRETERHNCFVTEYDDRNGLLKVEQFGKELIFNVRSPEFIKAEIDA